MIVINRGNKRFDIQNIIQLLAHKFLAKSGKNSSSSHFYIKKLDRYHVVNRPLTNKSIFKI